jgi:F-type H+-transporting ATPase subunit gamma
MPKTDGLKDLINTMKGLEDLTNVLEQIAARDIAQMRSTILQSRPYFQEIWKVYRVIKQIVPPPTGIIHKHLVVVVGIDWGMPGDLLNRVVKKGEELYSGYESDLLIAGKMAHSRFSNDAGRTVHLFSLPKKANLESIEPIYTMVAQYARVHVVYPRFESLSHQVVEVVTLAVGDSEIEAETPTPDTDKLPVAASRFIIEPNPQAIADYMNQTIIGTTLYHYFAEAQLAYSAAQMVAMRNSHDNAKSEVTGLTSKYNRARRALIDTKLRELYGAVTTK